MQPPIYRCVQSCASLALYDYSRYFCVVQIVRQCQTIVLCPTCLLLIISNAGGAHCTILDILLCTVISASNVVCASKVFVYASMVLARPSTGLCLCLDSPCLCFDGPHSHFDCPRSCFNRPRSQFNGLRSQFNGPRSQLDGPPLRFDGPHSHSHGPCSPFYLARYMRQGVVNKLLWMCLPRTSTGKYKTEINNSKKVRYYSVTGKK